MLSSDNELIVEQANEITRLTQENEELKQQLETEIMRLVACGVVALANTRESAARARTMSPKYSSASLADVCRAVDSEMAYERRLQDLEKMILNYGITMLQSIGLSGEEADMKWREG